MTALPGALRRVLVTAAVAALRQVLVTAAVAALLKVYSPVHRHIPREQHGRGLLLLTRQAPYQSMSCTLPKLCRYGTAVCGVWSVFIVAEIVLHVASLCRPKVDVFMWLGGECVYRGMV